MQEQLEKILVLSSDATLPEDGRIPAQRSDRWIHRTQSYPERARPTIDSLTVIKVLNNYYEHEQQRLSQTVVQSEITLEEENAPQK